jgi:hypothetical protein
MVDCLKPSTPGRSTSITSLQSSMVGKSQLNNLALACSRCNRNKGPNIAGFDKNGNEIVRLYHPRRDKWTDHFRWRGPRLLGLTPLGRVTIRVLVINHPKAVALRRELIAEGVFPPYD